MLIGIMCALSNGDIFNDIDGPLTGFQGHGIFEVEYLNNLVTNLL